MQLANKMVFVIELFEGGDLRPADYTISYCFSLTEDLQPKSRKPLHVKRCSEGEPNSTRLNKNAVGGYDKSSCPMMKNAVLLCKALGDVRIRLLRNVDDSAQFLQVIEYQTDQALELNRHKLASDPMMHNYMQAWRALFPGAIELDVYEDVTESV